ncbi:hypothetical protein QBC47DRAFT_299400 [Echria macrotheca]|uniref:Uncharacterized protein n=1 Tax=Echria macrotheca TaxID=438768 RepID=A0AAJ0F691_9PEZI|nr:hypothetical protein QBC47DRAFT_299400 [Echria macrotheca]
MPELDAQGVLSQMASASLTLRDAISKALPVSPTQVMTVQIPGLTLDPKDYVWDQDKTTYKPLAVRENESRLVDSMVPVAKLMMGRTGKSVARSYLAALDTLIPVEASVSGTIALNKDKKLPPRFETIRNRYTSAMKYLTSNDEASGKSKLTVYVTKQDAWNKAIEQYAAAQQRQQGIISREGLTPAEQRDKYLEWLQAYARDYKAMIQARYMDWVVHGYKFEVEFNFGVVDVSSGMKRIESSKEAIRNLTIIGIDGASEYVTVNLSPPGWATDVATKYNTWASRNQGPSIMDLRAEIKRLGKLLISHQALIEAMDDDQGFMPVVASGGGHAADDVYRDKMKALYLAQDQVNKEVMSEEPSAANAKAGSDGRANADRAAAEALEAAKKWNEANLESNKVANRVTDKAMRETIRKQLGLKIAEIQQEITQINDQLKRKLEATDGAHGGMPAVLDEETKTIAPGQLKIDPELNAPPAQKPSPWTRISAKISRSQATSATVSKTSASSFAAQVSTGLWSVSGGASHSSSSTESATDMSSLDVEISMDCMLVEIQRPWLHAELFSDPELDVADGFDLSPGPEKLQADVANHRPIDDKYEQFCSYPSAFVVAADVELEFTGNTSHLESKLEASRTEANLKVGYGPFSFGGSHSQSRNSAKTSAEATATGMRISLQAPQIIAWVSELLPALPRKNGASKMAGLLLEPPSASAVVAKPAAATVNGAK